MYRGVSTSVATVHLYWTTGGPTVTCARLPVHHFDCLLRSVLGRGQMGKQCRADLCRSAACPGAVVSTRRLKHGLQVSGAGLLPIKRLNTNVIVPCYKFGPRRWVRRQLTNIEQAAVVDILVLHEHLEWEFTRIWPGLLTHPRPVGGDGERRGEGSRLRFSFRGTGREGGKQTAAGVST